MENACIQQEQPHRCAAAQAPDGPCHPVGQQKGVHMARDIYIKMIIALLEKCDDENLLDLIWKILLKCI